MEYKTFENLRQHEVGAMPKRMEVRGEVKCVHTVLKLGLSLQMSLCVRKPKFGF